MPYKQAILGIYKNALTLYGYINLKSLNALMKCMNNKKGCPLYYVLLTLNYIYAP